MTIKSGVIVAGLVCLLSVFASANGIPITGQVQQGFGEFNGDFFITGTNLSLGQGTPAGPDILGTCKVGAVCKFSFNIGSTATFCTYCNFFSGGSLGTKIAEFLVPNLTLTGSALYHGGSSLNVPLTMTGTIIGYELVGCDIGGAECSLGPQLFTLSIVAHGTGQITVLPIGSGTVGIAGFVISNLTGTATVIPEPVSFVLTGTGLAGIWVRRRLWRGAR